MSLLPKCSVCERENIGGNLDTGVCHRCASSEGEAQPADPGETQEQDSTEGGEETNE